MTYSKTYSTPYAYDAAMNFSDDLRKAGFEDQACELEDDLCTFIYGPAPTSDCEVVYAIGGDLHDPKGYWKAEAYKKYTRVTLFTPNAPRQEEIAARQIRECYGMGCGIPDGPAHYLCKLAGREDDFMHTADEEELYDLLCEVADFLGVDLFTDEEDEQ